MVPDLFFLLKAKKATLNLQIEETRKSKRKYQETEFSYRYSGYSRLQTLKPSEGDVSLYSPFGTLRDFPRLHPSFAVTAGCIGLKVHPELFQ